MAGNGTAFAETDLDRADYETTIADLMTGQHNDPLRVVVFNPDTDHAEDVSHVIAQEILRRLGLEGHSVPSVLEDFIDCHVGLDRQLTPAAGSDIRSSPFRLSLRTPTGPSHLGALTMPKVLLVLRSQVEPQLYQWRKRRAPLRVPQYDSSATASVKITKANCCATKA